MMNEHTRTNGHDGSTIEARLAALENELITLRASSSARKRARRPGRAIIAIGIVLAVAVPAVVFASDRFPDVPSSNVHHDNINAIANAGISLGCTGGNYCPADTVRRDQMASFLARGLALGPGKLAVANAKGTLPTYCKLVDDFPRSFEASSCLGHASAVDTGGFTGLYTSIAIGTDGNPVISYYDSTNGDLKVAKCANPACTGAATLTAVDTAGDVGHYTSIAIGTDGTPVISYWDATNADLKVARPPVNM